VITTPVVVVGIYAFLIRSAWREFLGSRELKKESAERVRQEKKQARMAKQQER
jgi:hypothetical protein